MTMLGVRVSVFVSYICVCVCVPSGEVVNYN